MKAKQKKVAKTVSTKKTKKATNSLKAKALHSASLDAKITKIFNALHKAGYHPLVEPYIDDDAN